MNVGSSVGQSINQDKKRTQRSHELSAQQTQFYCISKNYSLKPSLSYFCFNGQFYPFKTEKLKSITGNTRQTSLRKKKKTEKQQKMDNLFINFPSFLMACLSSSRRYCRSNVRVFGFSLIIIIIKNSNNNTTTTTTGARFGPALLFVCLFFFRFLFRVDFRMSSLIHTAAKEEESQPSIKVQANGR